MSDTTDTATETEDATDPADAGVQTNPAHANRETAPQGPYTSSQLLFGAVVFLVGAVVAYGLPFVL